MVCFGMCICVGLCRIGRCVFEDLLGVLYALKDVEVGEDGLVWAGEGKG